jgi:hypothetical protein
MRSEEELAASRAAYQAYNSRRSRRKHPVRPKQERLTKLPMFRRLAIYQEGADLTTEEFGPRPATRADCGEQRPCPYVGCKYNLYLDVTPNGNLKVNFPDLAPEDMKVSCVLDVADVGGVTLEDTGERLNMTRERVRQIEEMGKKTLNARLRTKGIRAGDTHWVKPTSAGEQLDAASLHGDGGADQGEPDYDVEDFEVIRWANEVVSEIRRVGLHKALELANKSTDDLGEEDPPL